jgi:tetratricopeptide (TPR) repeat protein
MYAEWQVLADWRRELGNVEGYLAAAETMAQLDPHNEVTLGYLGEALLNCGDRAGAKRAFAKSRQIDPAYLFGGLWLFDLQVEDGEWEQADRTLSDLELHVGGRYVLARRIQMAAHQESLYHARRALQALCTTPAENEDPWPLRHALDVMQRANWLREMDEVVTGSLDDPDVDPHVGELWARLQVLRRSWLAGRRMESLVRRGEIGRHALHGWVLALLDAGEIARFRAFVAQNHDWLAAETAPWGITCMGWAASRDYVAGRAWAASWESHPDAKQWMLVNVAEIFRNTGDDELGARVNRRALELPPDNTESLHALWLSVDDVRRDRLEEAVELLQRVDPDVLDDDYQFLLTMIETELVLASADPSERAEVSRECRRRIDELVRNYKVLRLEPARRRVYRRCLAATARRSGGLGPLLWSWWRRLTTA